jgi:hypothetical protein
MSDASVSPPLVEAWRSLKLERPPYVLPGDEAILHGMNRPGFSGELAT